jgi:ligand-binding sensor domain-containing protein/two-component sensor histidine kinase
MGISPVAIDRLVQLVMLLRLQKVFIYFLLSVFLPSVCAAQEFNYVHYDTKDGLAASTVYRICQDKDGFLWFATENGLSRFDGTRFTNFTVRDGLPDNEIIKVYADTKGRVWILPFRKSICYYYQNKIYNRFNDSTLAKLTFYSNPHDITEDEQQNIAIVDHRQVLLITKEGEARQIFQIMNKPHANLDLGIRYDYHYRAFLIATYDSLYTYKNGSVQFETLRIPLFDRLAVDVINYPTANRYVLDIPEPYINTEANWYHTTYVNTSNGSWKVDPILKKLTTHFLPGKKVSCTFEDNEGAFWFATLGEGVYKLASRETRTIPLLQAQKHTNNEVFSITKYGDALLCGLSYSQAVFVKDDKVVQQLNFEDEIHRTLNQGRTNRLYCSEALSSGVLLMGFDSYLGKLDKGQRSFSGEFPIKSIAEIDDEHVLIGTGKYTFRMRVSDLHITDTIWHERTTNVIFHEDNYYIGTLNGLYEVKKDKSYKHLGEVHPALNRRIVDMVPGADGSLYIATHDEGVAIYKDEKVTATITTDNGMSSNICRALFLNNNYLWIGTNKGLNKVNIVDSKQPITRFSVSDGLPSDNINAVYVKDSIIWIGSPAGLTYFNENRISATSICNLRMLNISVSGRQQDIRDHYQLGNKDNNISFEFIAISFKSGGDIVYHYKLDGLDKDWKETLQTNLIYQSLPSGNYKLQLFAVNKFGVKSNTIVISFIIATPFWKEWWFYGIVILTVVGITFWIVNSRARAFIAAKEEKNRTQQQFAALEQQALQAQMNPHFIFNCLNSIQQYVLTNDKEKANQYLTAFASLIRQTLDNSGKKTITVSEEVSYLNRYLQMEAMRFGENFSYEIIVDDMVNTDIVELPAMLLQPYVENCLRHGIRYKNDGTGKVTISFSMLEDALYCRIRDNGIGREKAAEWKSRQHIEYQSQGMKLTDKRIELLNKINTSAISATVVDLKDEQGNATGTEVIIKIPL